MAIDRSKVSKQAEAYIAAGKVDRAIEEFNKLLEDKPDDSNMINRVGDIYFQAGRLPEAVEMFRRAANGFERDGFSNKATAVLKKAHRAVPDDVDVAARLADLYRQTNLIKDAIQIHIEVADIFTKKGLIKRALEEFAQVVELDPKNIKNKVKLADLYNKEGLKDRAVTIYLEVAEALALEQMHAEASQVLERAKAMVSSPQVFLTQSKLCVIQKDLEGAAQALRQGLESNPRSPEILEALGELELQSRHPDKVLEVLAIMPQMGERALHLCERALRELSRSGRVDLGLQLFYPIGKEFARRGSGELVANALQNALQGNFTAEAWIQLSEIHHQSGNKQERLDALLQALSTARIQGSTELAEKLAEQLGTFGVSQEQIASLGQGEAPQSEKDVTATFDNTDVDPVKQMQIQQLIRDAENYVRNRFPDKAQEAYQGILDLDPANRDAINRIAEIIQSTGKMTGVQMHYVKMAEKLAPLGFKTVASEMLDRAEALFPGSTRLYRRTLGLTDLHIEPMPAQSTLPSAPSIFLAQTPTTQGISPIASFPGAPEEPPASMPSSPMDIPDFAAPPEISMPGGLEALIGLDLGEGLNPTIALPRTTPPFQPPLEIGTPWEALEVPGITPPTVPTPWDSSPRGLWKEPPTQPLPPLPEPESPLPLLPADMDWSDLSGESELHGSAAELGLEPLELEPLSFIPQPPAPVPAPPVIDDELANLLPDIDFQLDYGSPEEAKIVILDALKSWPSNSELQKRLESAEANLRKLGHETKSKALDESDFTASFFDLTDVLGEALLETGEGEEMHDVTNVVEKIQSVEELFDAFREGVEQQVRVDDYDTHYNLGIAYKEMMLIEPAMEEFKKAMLDPERTLECCSMLSICELSQGNLEAATTWLRKGILAPGFPPEDAIGLRYDLGETLISMGLPEEAKIEFNQVYELDPDYRDIAAKI
jgi:pilus assembly protein FimV